MKQDLFFLTLLYLEYLVISRSDMFVQLLVDNSIDLRVLGKAI